jgi:hypothetical protein
MKYPTLPGFLLDIPEYEEITENEIRRNSNYRYYNDSQYSYRIA